MALSMSRPDTGKTHKAIFTIKNNEKPFYQYSGYMVRISDTHCALYDGSQIDIFQTKEVCKIIIR